LFFLSPVMASAKRVIRLVDGTIDDDQRR